MLPIIGFHIKSISADKKNLPKERVDINSSPSVVSVSKTTVGLKKKEQALNIGFQFITKYEPNIGEIKIEGDVLFVGNKIDNILKFWNKEKKLLPEVEVEVKNFLFRKCMTIGINLSENMSLPPPLMFPTVIIDKKQRKNESDMRYIG